MTKPEPTVLCELHLIETVEAVPMLMNLSVEQNPVLKLQMISQENQIVKSLTHLCPLWPRLLKAWSYPITLKLLANKLLEWLPFLFTQNLKCKEVRSPPN